MKCLSNERIIKYMERSLNSVEYAITRDHLLSCEKCKLAFRQLSLLEEGLGDPVLIEPPLEIEKFVMKKLFPGISHIASVISLIAASFFLLITWIYIYFDFANDSMIKAFQLTKDQAASLISGAVKFVSVIFSGLFTLFKAINTLLEVLLNVRIGVEITGMIIAFVLLTLSYLIYNKLFLRIRDSRNNR